MNKRHRGLATAAPLCAGLLWALLPAAAPAVDWSGSGGNNNWSTAANWVGGVAPASANTTIVTFGAAGTTFTPAADAAWTINQLSLTGGTPYALTGSTLTFDGASAQCAVSGAAHTIANNLSLAAPLALNNAVDLTLPGTIGGAGGDLTKTGAGRLTLSGASTMAGTTFVNAGVLQLGDGGFEPSTFGPVVVNAALETNVTGGLTLQGTTGTGSLTVLGGGPVSIGPDFAHTGPTTVNAGGLLGGHFPNSGRLTIAATGRVDTFDSTFGSLAGAGLLNTNSGTVTVGGDNTSTTFSGTIASTGAIAKVGTGRLILSGPMPFSGGTTVSAGVLQLGDGGFEPSTFGPVVVNAALETNVTGGLTLQGTTGTGSLTVLGGGLVSIGPDFAHTGPTTVNAGGLLGGHFPNSGRLTIAATGRVDTFDSTFGSLAGAGLLNTNSGTVTVGGDNTSTTFSGTIASTGAIAKVGTGRLILSGPMPFSGGTTVSAGVLQLGDGGFEPTTFGPVVVNAALETNVTGGLTLQGTTGTGSLTVLGGGLVSIGPDFAHTGPTTVNAGGLLGGHFPNSGRLTIAATGRVDTFDSTFGSLAGAGLLNTNSGTVTVGGDNTSTTFSGVIGGGGGGITKVGAGTLTLTGTSTYTGGTSVNGGRLFVNGTIPGTVTVNAGGVLGGTGTVSGPVVVNAGGTIAPGLSPGQTNTGSINIAGVFLEEIEGTVLGTQYDNLNVTGTVNFAATAILTLAGAYAPVAGNTFVIISNDGADPVTGTFTGLAEGATIVFNGATLRISYAGGDGNDVVLTALSTGAAAAVPIPTLPPWGLALLSILMAAAGLAAVRRSRLPR